MTPLLRGTALLSPPPILARDATTLPWGEDWSYEFNWAGERVRAIKRNSGVRLIAKDGRELANRFPRVAAAVARLRPGSAAIDGEVLLLDAYSPAAIERLAQVTDDISQARVALLAYDLLELEGNDLRSLSLLCRRLKLTSVVQGTPIILSPRLFDTPANMLAEAARLGLSGIVAKRAGAAYRPNSATQEWLRVAVSGAQQGRQTRSPWAA